MKPLSVQVEKASLEKWINTVHGGTSNDYLTKECFLSASFDAISSLVHFNKSNLLVQEAVRTHPDLIVRGFTILSVLYGAYSMQPRKYSVIKDFVSMLDGDLIEEELRVSDYAKRVGKTSFFPQLSSVLETIREIYDAEHFPLEVLPPTSHQAYALYVLNRRHLLEKEISKEEIYGHIATLWSGMSTALSITKSTA